MASSVFTYDAFVCSKCGACCKKQKAVLLTVYDIFRLSRHLGIKPGGLYKRYCTRSSKFNNEGLKRYYLKTDGGLRDSTRSTLLEQAVGREETCRADPYYAGAIGMYISGFYGLFRQEAKKSGAAAFEPSSLGIADDTMTLVLSEKDYNEAKKVLSQGLDWDVHTKAFAYNGREYLIFSAWDKDGNKVLFYYHIEPESETVLRHRPGELEFNINGEKGGDFVFHGRDADGWLSQPPGD